MVEKLHILVVDDVDANRRLISRFVSALGHVTTTAANGEEAVEACRSKLPDLILLDIMMPVMDGITAAKEIRRLCGEHWLPIIFLSAKSTEIDQIAGLEIADDYLPKPIDLAILGAKIKVMARIADMQQRLADNAERLEAYRSKNEEEQQFTRHILDNMIGYSNSATGPLKRWIKPATKLSGDVIAHAWSPTGNFHLLIADSAGHGLAAAMSAMPAVDVFSSMAHKGFGIGCIAREINDKLNSLLPVGHFAAAALICIEPYRGQIQIWNGGIPTVLFLNSKGQVTQQWPSRHPPLGILSDADFDPTVSTSSWREPGEIFVCSDGLTEAENEHGERFGSERLLFILAAAQGHQSFDAVVNAVGNHLSHCENQDDISIASIACTDALTLSHFASFAPPGTHPGAPTVAADLFPTNEWTLHLRFSAKEIASQNTLPMLITWFGHASLNAVQLGEVQLILSELFTNAVDHGVLGLDSVLKQGLDGFETYHRERLARLAGLETGSIEVHVERLLDNARPLLRLSIKDSGSGFDHQHLLTLGDTENPLSYGRGIALIRNLVPTLHYEGRGNEAVVEYPL